MWPDGAVGGEGGGGGGGRSIGARRGRERSGECSGERSRLTGEAILIQEVVLLVLVLVLRCGCSGHQADNSTIVERDTPQFAVSCGRVHSGSDHGRPKGAPSLRLPSLSCS